MAEFFGLNEDFLCIGELFVAKYECKEGKQKSLGAHQDGTPWSFVIALNCPSTEFTGGGTHFVNEKTTYRPKEAGTAVIFSGKNLHSGVEVTSGTRYILTGFCNYFDTDTSHDHFLTNYVKEFDGSAARCSNNGDGNEGIHSGDIIRGVWVNAKKNAVVGNASPLDEPFGYEMTAGMSADEVQQLIQRSAARSPIKSSSGSGSRSSTQSQENEYSILVERQPLTIDFSDEKQLQLDDRVNGIKKQAARRLAVGKFWKFDDFLPKLLLGNKEEKK